MPDSNQIITLWNAAGAYLAQGYSVIPLRGAADPARPKVAAVPWRPFQYARATDHDLRSWFLDDHFGALGLVTGRISRLVVLDFDTPERFHTFSHQHPDLVVGYLVQTHRGFHIYYHLPPHLPVSSKRGRDIDLLSDGRYVVAPPSLIDGHRYQLLQDAQPHLLSAPDIEHISRFLHDSPSSQNITVREGFKPCPMMSQRGSQTLPYNTIPLNRSPLVKNDFNASLIPPLHCIETRQRLGGEVSQSPRALTAHDLTACYAYHSRQVGRNEALFRASLKARDAGWTLEQTTQSLLEIHVQQPATLPHQPETRQLRAQEAVRTVNSAFSRPPRPQTRTRQAAALHVPNTVREALLKLGRTDVIRTLDGLLGTGIAPGQTFHAEEAVTLLRGIVGRDSIYHALNALTPDNLPIFEQVSPSALPIAPDGAAAGKNRNQNKKMHFVREEIPGINGRGRPKRVFVLPHNLELCHKLGVKPSASDPLSLDDLSSARTTRMALHRELIKRRPGIYPRRWLARRVGVSSQTIDAYNHDIPIHVRHLYQEIRLSWSNLHLVPDGFRIDGAFLQDETGKRYPAIRPLAAKLLVRGHTLIYKRQDANYYWYGDTPPDLSILFGQHPRQPEMDVRLTAILHFAQTHAPDTLYAGTSATGNSARFERASNRYSLAGRLPASGGVTATIPQILVGAPPPIRPQSGSKRRYHKPLKDEALEHRAQAVCTRIGSLSLESKGHMSQATARRLVSTFDPQLIEQGLSIISQRRGIANPAGFLVSWLKSESRKGERGRFSSGGGGG